LGVPNPHPRRNTSWQTIWRKIADRWGNKVENLASKEANPASMGKVNRARLVSKADRLVRKKAQAKELRTTKRASIANAEHRSRELNV
jgi:hypothetical protein